MNDHYLIESSDKVKTLQQNANVTEILTLY